MARELGVHVTKRLVLLFVAALAACSPAPQAEKPTITVYADSALTEAFTRIGSEFEAAQGVRVKFVFGSSTALEKQLGAGVDVYASASQESMKLMSKVFALNRLVLAVPEGNPRDMRGLNSLSPESSPPTSYAMCVEEAPCGAAAKQALMDNGGAAPPKAVGQDVKETLAKLSKREVDSAFVYATDVRANPGLEAVQYTRFENEKLKFPIAVVSGTSDAKKFYDYVFSDAAKKALTEAGFELP